MRVLQSSHSSMKLLPVLVGLGLGLLLGRWISTAAPPSCSFAAFSLTEKAAGQLLRHHPGRHDSKHPAAAEGSRAEVGQPIPSSPKALVPQKSLGVVLARHNEDISWVDQLQQRLQAARPSLKVPVMINVYQTPGKEVEGTATQAQLAEAEEAAEAPAEAAAASRQAATGVRVRQCHTIMNRGHEAMAFLTAIIDSYNSSSMPLPDLSLFLHAHRHGNHTHLTPDWSIRRLALSPSVELPLGYMPVQCKEEPPDWGIFFPTNPNATEAGFKREMLAFILQGWSEEFSKWLGPLPERLLAPPNAEFVVTREAILRRPLAFYLATRRWLMRTSLRSFLAAMVMEYLWALVFTGQGEFWVSQEECMCQLYGACLEGRF